MVSRIAVSRASDTRDLLSSRHLTGLGTLGRRGMNRVWSWPALALIAVLAVTGCGDDAAPWPKTAGNTTCAEWIDTMTVDQRSGLANAILTILWDRDGAASTPGPDVQTKFANAIGGTCTSFRTESVNSVASGLYLLSDDVKP